MKKLCTILKSKLEIKRFLESSVPHFSNFLTIESVPTSDEQRFNISVEESNLTKEMIINLAAGFLGSIGSMAHFVATKNKVQDNCIFQSGEIISLKIPLSTRTIDLDLGVLLRRVSELAAENTDSKIQNISCE